MSRSPKGDALAYTGSGCIRLPTLPGMVGRGVVICPTGKSALARENLSIPSRKNIPLVRWTCWCRKASDANADGEVVWS
jgi:hypothetical protein